MDWSMVGALAEAIGAAAVVLSLVYLSVQVRQSTGVARASYHIQQSANYRTLVSSMMSDEGMASIFARGLADPRELSTEEYQRFLWCMGEIFQHYQAQVEGAKAGIVEPHYVQSWLNVTASWVAMPGGREAWDVLGGFNSPQVRGDIHGALEAIPPFDELAPRYFDNARTEAVVGKQT